MSDPARQHFLDAKEPMLAPQALSFPENEDDHAGASPTAMRLMRVGH